MARWFQVCGSMTLLWSVKHYFTTSWTKYEMLAVFCNFQARLEVHKFGITGYKKQEQRLWEQERAIMLGAKVIATCLCWAVSQLLQCRKAGRFGTTLLKHEIRRPALSPTSSLLLYFLFCLFSVDIWRISMVMLSEVLHKWNTTNWGGKQNLVIFNQDI